MRLFRVRQAPEPDLCLHRRPFGGARSSIVVAMAQVVAGGLDIRLRCVPQINLVRRRRGGSRDVIPFERTAGCHQVRK
jgi:hypothetical protein